MEFYFSDCFDFPLPEKHRFPGMKYGMLRDQLVREGILRPSQLLPSPLAEKSDVYLAHDQDFVDQFEAGSLSPTEMRRIGFPWSEFFVKRCRATVGGAIAAAYSSLENGISGQLAGGTHHAHRSFGSGYCVYNDQAVVALKLLNEQVVERVAIVDLDVHQGDGTASILKDHESVFVFSMHGKKNFPFRKSVSDLDVELDDNTDDDTYLEKLSDGFQSVKQFDPQLILYQAGADVLATDKLGRIQLSLTGLQRRDRYVLSYAKASGIPLSMAIGGGYSDPIQQSVDGYKMTYRVAKEVYSF